MPEEKETQDQAVGAQRVLVCGDTYVNSRARPEIESSAQFRIVFDEQNRDRNDNVGTSFHQSGQRLFRVGFRQDDKSHDGMTKHLDPSLESHERKVGPKDGKKTINEKDREPLIVPNNFRELNVPFAEHISARCNQREVDASIERASLLQSDGACVKTKGVEPFRRLPGTIIRNQISGIQSAPVTLGLSRMSLRKRKTTKATVRQDAMDGGRCIGYMQRSEGGG